MSIKLEDEYPGRATPASSSYPGGSFKSVSTEGAEDGTPLEIEWANDKEGFFQGLLSSAEIEANGNVDTAVASQYLNALNVAMGKQRTCPPTMTRADLCRGMLAHYIHDPTENPNTISVVDTTWRDSCIGWPASSDFPYIYFLNHNSNPLISDGVGRIACWEYATNLTTEILSLEFGHTIDQYLAICSDGPNIYIAFGVNAGNVHVAKFSASGGTALWLCDTTIAFAGSLNEKVRILSATSTRLALFVDGTIVIINEYGDVTGIGTGTHVSGCTIDYQEVKIVTTTAHVFWIESKVVDDSTLFYLTSAQIADPSISSYPAYLIATCATVQPHTWPKSILRLYRDIVMHSYSGHIWLYSTDDEEVHKYAQLMGYTPYETVPDNYDPSDVQSGFDGLNVWLTGVDADRTEDPSERGCLTFFKIPASYFSRRGGYLDTDVNEITASRVRCDTDTAEQTYVGGKLFFDGRDMIYTARGAKVYRVYNPGMR
jgi:hypothetical protein